MAWPSTGIKGPLVTRWRILACNFSSEFGKNSPLLTVFVLLVLIAHFIHIFGNSELFEAIKITLLDAVSTFFGAILCLGLVFAFVFLEWSFESLDEKLTHAYGRFYRTRNPGATSWAVPELIWWLAQIVSWLSTITLYLVVASPFLFVFGWLMDFR